MMGQEISAEMIAKGAKQASFALAASAAQVRSGALEAIADALEREREAIFAANRQDIEAAQADGLSAPALKRLKFDENKLADVCAGLRALAAMDDPIGCE